MRFRDVAACVLLGFTGGFFSGFSAGWMNRQHSAIEAGVAECRIDPKTDESTFHYLTPETSDANE